MPYTRCTKNLAAKGYLVVEVLKIVMLIFFSIIVKNTTPAKPANITKSKGKVVQNLILSLLQNTKKILY